MGQRLVAQVYRAPIIYFPDASCGSFVARATWASGFPASLLGCLIGITKHPQLPETSSTFSRERRQRLSVSSLRLTQSNFLALAQICARKRHSVCQSSSVSKKIRSSVRNTYIIFCFRRRPCTVLL